MGFHPNMPRIVVYVPKQLGGMGLQRLYTNQGVKNVTQMLKHLRAGSTIGKLFQVDIDWHQRWSGIGKCIMKRPKVEIPPNSSNYLTEIRKFLSVCRASVHLKECPTVLRARDSFVMDHILRLNMCRRKVDCITKSAYTRKSSRNNQRRGHQDRPSLAGGGAKTVLVNTEVARNQETIKEDVEHLESGDKDHCPR